MYERERPFDHSAGTIEYRDSKICTKRAKDVIAYIREHNLVGERRQEWIGFLRGWLNSRKWYRRTERGCYSMTAPFPGNKK